MGPLLKQSERTRLASESVVLLAPRLPPLVELAGVTDAPSCNSRMRSPKQLTHARRGA